MGTENIRRQLRAWCDEAEEQDAKLYESLRDGNARRTIAAAVRRHRETLRGLIADAPTAAQQSILTAFSATKESPSIPSHAQVLAEVRARASAEPAEPISQVFEVVASHVRRRVRVAAMLADEELWQNLSAGETSVGGQAGEVAESEDVLFVADGTEGDLGFAVEEEQAA